MKVTMYLGKDNYEIVGNKFTSNIRKGNHQFTEVGDCLFFILMDLADNQRT